MQWSTEQKILWLINQMSAEMKRHVLGELEEGWLDADPGHQIPWMAEDSDWQEKAQPTEPTDAQITTALADQGDELTAEQVAEASCDFCNSGFGMNLSCPIHGVRAK